MTVTLNFQVQEKDGNLTILPISINQAIIAGWTGRDKAAVEKHIIELEELGVMRPVSTPLFYRVSASRLTQQPLIETSGTESSGEIEFVIIKHEGNLYVGVGSDHTDRKVETYNVTVSKQMCEKPIACDLWRFEDVAEHWDRLELHSWINGDEAYQTGLVSAMLPPLELIDLYGSNRFVDGTAMFCGTIAAIGGIRPAPDFRFMLQDPVWNRKIGHGYRMKELEIVG